MSGGFLFNRLHLITLIFTSRVVPQKSKEALWSIHAAWEHTSDERVAGHEATHNRGDRWRAMRTRQASHRHVRVAGRQAALAKGVVDTPARGLR